MGLNAKTAAGAGSRIEPMESGTYPARLVQVIDMGLQPQRPFKSEEKPPAYEFMLTYEFVDEFLKDEDGQEQKDKPRWLSESMPLYNLEADRAKSTARYKALDPTLATDGDWVRLLGTPCMVTVVQNPGKGQNAGRIYENVAEVGTMRAKDVERTPELVNEPKAFDLSEPDLGVFLSLPKWVQEKVSSNLEFEGSELQKMLKEAGDATPEKAEDADENPY